MFFLVFLASSDDLIGQSTQPNQLTVEQGLPSNEIFDACQDSLGFIWVATSRGLSRYDGLNFRNYDSENGIPGTAVLGIRDDGKGRLWCIVDGDKIIYIEHGEIIVPDWFDALRNFPSMRLNSVASINDTIYFGLQSFRKDPNILFMKVSGEGEIEFVNGKKPPLHNGLEVLTIGPNIVYGSKRKFESDTIDIDFEGKEEQYVLPMSRVDPLKVISTENGLRLATGNRVFFQEKSYSAWECASTITNSLSMDSKGNFWVGTERHGVYMFRGNSFSQSPLQLFSKYGVSRIFEDRFEGYWVATLNDGMFYYPSLEALTSNEYQYNKSWRNGGIIGERLYLVSESHELFSAQKHDAVWEYNRLASYNKILSSHFTDTEVHLGTSGIANIKEIRTKHYSPCPGIYVLKDSRLLLTNYTGGVRIVTAGKERTVGKNLLKNIRVVHETDEAVYLGGEGGLFQLRDENITSLKDKHEDLNERVLSIGNLGDTILAGVAGRGLIVISPDKVMQLSRNHGLTSNFINDIKVVGNKVWLATDRGINVVNWKSGGYEIIHIGQDQGLHGRKVAKLVDWNGSFVALTNKGLSTHQKNFEDITTRFSRVLLESVKVNGKNRKPGELSKLNWNERNIVVEVEQILFSKDLDRGFYYKAEPEQNQWVFSQSPRLSFINLSPGSYVFKFAPQPSDFDMVMLQVNIDSPFWNSVWFWIIASLSIILGSSIYWRRSILIARKEMNQENEMLILQYRALRSQINSHFLYNALNSIQNMIIKKETQSSLKYLGKLNRLLRSVFDNANQNLVSIRNELESLYNYVDMEEIRYPGLINLEVEKKYQQSFLVPPLLLQPLVENAILHGILPKGEKGTILIKMDQEGNRIRITISDDGVGLEKSKIQKELSRFQIEGREGRKNSGLEVSKKRIQSMCRANRCPYEFEMKPMYPESKYPGNVVTFIIPLKEESS